VYTVNKTGYYRISAAVQFGASSVWQANTNGYFQVLLNGGTTILSSNVRIPTAYTGQLMVPSNNQIAFLTAGQTLQLAAGTTTGAANPLSGNTSINQFSVEEL
jgi:hypothetical protein